MNLILTVLKIWAKGPQVSLGYLNNPSATASTYDSSGYLHTGDLGHIAPNGFLYITSRLKEILKVRGHPVPPTLLEDTLLTHPCVADCAVIGIPDEYSGEIPQAWVVLNDVGVDRGEELMRQELVRLVEGRRERHMWLKGGIMFVHELPKSAAGKILRRVLKERAEKMGKPKL